MGISYRDIRFIGGRRAGLRDVVTGVCSVGVRPPSRRLIGRGSARSSRWVRGGPSPTSMSARERAVSGANHYIRGGFPDFYPRLQRNRPVAVAGNPLAPRRFWYRSIRFMATSRPSSLERSSGRRTHGVERFDEPSPVRSPAATESASAGSSMRVRSSPPRRHSPRYRELDGSGKGPSERSSRGPRGPVRGRLTRPIAQSASYRKNLHDKRLC